MALHVGKYDSIRISYSLFLSVVCCSELDLVCAFIFHYLIARIVFQDNFRGVKCHQDDRLLICCSGKPSIWSRVLEHTRRSIRLHKLAFSLPVDGEVKIKIESLASQVRYPLRSICTMENSMRRLFQSDVLMLGWPWKRSILLSTELFDHKNIEEVVTTIVRAIGS